MQRNRRSPYGGSQVNRGWLSRQLRRRPRPLWLVCALHVLALGVALLLYALPHHVLPRVDQAVGITSQRESVERPTAVPAAPMPEAEPTPAPQGENAGASDTMEIVSAPPTQEPTITPEPTEEPEPIGVFRRKFADHFTASGVEQNMSGDRITYRSPNVDIVVSRGFIDSTNSTYYVADIYIADISYLTTGFANDTYGRSQREWPSDMARRYGALVTINGDYYGAREGGIVIRNGTLYRDGKNSADVCALYWDGTMKTFDPWNFSAETEMSNGCYQAWNFGPGLLEADGTAKTSFNSSVNKANPRSVIGYFEPGHYCFVAVEGRVNGAQGLTMQDLAKLMQMLGCKQAYNLDGGNSSMLCVGTKVLNTLSGGGRSVSDSIMILDGATY